MMKVKVIVLPQRDFNFKLKLRSNDDFKKRFEFFWDFALEKTQIRHDLPPRLSRILCSSLLFVDDLFSFLGMLGNENLWGRVHCFFVAIHLIPASHVLDIYECLGFSGEKDDILVSHCLLVARYYIYCCKFKNITSSIREYAQQLKYNLKLKNKYLS